MAVLTFLLSLGLPVGTAADMPAERDLLPEEKAAGSDDPATQARLILEESEDRATAPVPVERRTSEDTVDL